MSSTTNDNTQLVESNEPSLDGVALLAAAEQGQLTAMNALTFGAVAKAAALTFGAVAKAAALTFGACATRGESAAASVGCTPCVTCAPHKVCPQFEPRTPRILHGQGGGSAVGT